ncbi:MAG: hypothetical protein PWQ82_1478 [Thermosediminibacterales bacterium]|nr:hypothetical protein [Thermosediminibacterales bacterium]MDK2836624.1 hypothetical protein [Thermosediminibacterales bacterium]
MQETVNKKILIVEDSRLQVQILRDILSRNGYEVETVMTGKEAIEKVRRGEIFDLILMDIELRRGMDGIQTSKVLQKLADIPIVFITAHTEKETVEKIRKATGYGFVLKNAGENVLISAVEMALRLYGANSLAKFYRKIIENSLNEIYIFHTKTLNFLAVNRGALKNIGYTEKELKTMTPLDINSVLDLEAFRNLIDPLLKGEREFCVFNTVHRRKDGSSYPVDVYLQIVEHRSQKVFVAVAIDLTEKKRIERKLKERQAFLDAIVNSAHDAIVMLDNQGKVTFWNPAAERIFGYLREEVIGKELHRLIVPSDEYYKRYKKALPHFQLTGEGENIGKTVELIARHKDGHVFDIELSLSALRIDDTWHAVGIARDITERKKTEELAYRLSITDPLTNAYNRRFFTQMLKQELKRAGRTGLPFSVIMVDLDHFKRVNDRFGHAAGDLVLKSLVDMIKGRIRKTDCLARWGGEEFVILLPDTPVDKAAGLAEELREHLSLMDIPGIGRVTASFGVAGYRPGDTVDTLLKKADDMMYVAKAAGRNCVRYI